MREPVLLGAIVVVGVAACVLALMTLRSESPTKCRSTLIPAYLRPDAMERMARQPVHGRVVIFNPSSGPHSEPEPAYERAVAALQRSGTRVLGYVHTAYGSRDPVAVETDIARYQSWYGVDGVFLDEVADADAQLGYYRALSQYVRANGEQLVVLNPGTVPARGFFDIADIVVTFEGPYSAYEPALAGMPDWLRRLAPSRSAHLIYGASGEQAAQAIGQDSAGFVYATSGTLPDPWSSLPPYLDRFEAQLEGCWQRESGAPA